MCVCGVCVQVFVCVCAFALKCLTHPYWMRAFPAVLQITFAQPAQGSGKKNTAWEEEDEEEMDGGGATKQRFK